jgi:hypothetical protein
MKSKKKLALIFFVVILLAACFARIYKLSEVPAGVYTDEASFGYNAYSLLLTGRDEYGKSWPLFFRAFSTFQDPLYGFLSIIPVYFFGLNIFSTRLISVISGLTVVVVTFALFYFSNLKNKLSLSLIAGVTVAFCPWALYQSRVAVGSNLGLALTAVGILLLVFSLKKRWLFIPACLVFGISAYAYAGERIVSILFPAAFLIVYRKIFSQSKKLVLVGFVLLILVQIPQFKSLSQSGSLIRYQTQGYTQKRIFLKNGASLAKLPTLIGWPLYIARQFTSQYLSDFSPRSLFFEPEPQLFRSIPDLSTFYRWMVIPFFIGFYQLWKKRSEPAVKIIFLLMVVGVLPEAVTGDPFYTLRMLPGLWGITLMIAFGLKAIFDWLKFRSAKILLVVFLIAVSGFSFYTSYFVFLKHERSVWYGYPFQVLAQMTEENKNQTFVVDSEMFDAPYIWLAFYKKYDPVKLQSQAPAGIPDHYYDDLTFYKYKTIGNVEVRKVSWGVDQCKDEYVVGDLTAISDSQAEEHKFTLIREIKDLDGKTILWVYHTNPQLKCAGGIGIAGPVI